MSVRRRSRGRAKPTYKWSGLQWENIAVSANGVALILVGGVEIERYGKCTVQAIRGGMTFHNTDSDAAGGVVRVGAKIGVYNVNDAGTLTDDVAGLDTHEEDISKRQLWTYTDFFRASATNLTVERRVEVYVKAGIILGDAKSELMLVANSSVVNRVRVTGYLRALIRLP